MDMVNNKLKDQGDALEMFSLQRTRLICSTALCCSFRTKGKLSPGSAGLGDVLSLLRSLPWAAASEKGTGAFLNTPKILAEYSFNNYRIAPLPPASPCVCSLPPALR